jgi:hypothetical protein
MIRDDTQNLEGDEGQSYVGQTDGLATHKLSLQTSHWLCDCKGCTHMLSEASNSTMMIDASRPASKRLNEGIHAAGMYKLPQVLHSTLHVNDTKRELLQQLLEDHVNDRYTQHNTITEPDRVSVLPSLINPMTSQTSSEFRDVYEALCNIDIIIDTGATCHCIPIKSVYNTYTELPAGTRNISYADGSISGATGIGNTCLLTDVLHVPTMKLGIISVSMLDKAGYNSMFADNKVVITDKEFEHILITGTLHKGLYTNLMMYMSER